MKIKHYQGYGFVEATKVSKKKVGGLTKLVIRVQGNHERGIERNDIYDAYNWLVKKFDKSVTDYTQIESMELNPTYTFVNDIPTDVCYYTFLY